MTQEGKNEVSSSSTSILKTVWQSLAPKLLNLVNASALLTVAGFFVIHSYLASFSNLSSYNISITQYLAAGINLILGMVWFIVEGLIRALPTTGTWLAILSAFALLGYIAISTNKRIRQLWQRFLGQVQPLSHRISAIVQFLWTGYQIFVLLILALFGFIYGTSYYGQSLRMFGGGRPTDVILVFKEDQPTQNSIWAFPINSKNPRQSEIIQLLIELTDGVIVRHSSTGMAVIVKNDVLQGIIDASPPLPDTPPVSTLTPTQFPATSSTP